MTLWCDGISQTATSVQTKCTSITVEDSSGSEEESHKTKSRKGKRKSAYKERLEQVDDIVDDRREKHGNKFSSIKYRVWAETIISAGRHTDCEAPPRRSFWRKSNMKRLSPSKHNTLPLWENSYMYHSN